MKESGKSQQKWYQGLETYCWLVLIVAALGWLFDTMDQNIFNLVRKPSLEDLLRAQYPDPTMLAAQVKKVGGDVTAIFLIGWSVGGFIFGVLGDRIGRTRTMILTILIYSLFTGLSGLAQTWQQYAACRFLTALGVGGEWAAGAAIVAEVFPERSRSMALGLLQALSAVGNMMAAIITYVLAFIPDSSWRWAYFIGAAPALLVLWIRRSVKEPERWEQAKKEARLGKELGAMQELFVNSHYRRNTLAGLMLGVAGVGALWGVGFFGTDLLNGQLKNLDPATVKKLTSIEFFVRQVGAMLGIYAFAAFSERTNRRSAFYLWFALAWISLLAYFWNVNAYTGYTAFYVALGLGFVMGFCTLGPFSGYTVYFPELFPTRLRTTGCGVCYNGGRLIAAVAPFTLGALAKIYGLPIAASIVSFIYIIGFIGTALGPETKGQPLPE